MLDLSVGSPREIAGAIYIATTPQMTGYAIYGDYVDYPAGRYAVEFTIARAEQEDVDRPLWARILGDFVCAKLDVAMGGGQVRLAQRNVRFSQIGAGPTRFVLEFQLDAPGRLEFRVRVNGRAPLLIADDRAVARLRDGVDREAALGAARFPDPSAPDAPPFLKEQAVTLRQLFDKGFGICVIDGDVVLTIDGVSFLARVPDDIFFAGEIFLERTYNLGTRDDACVIDIGMNSGLVSLLMAARDAVKEVHAFEPFAETIARARANLALNPAIAHKITAHQIGLSDHDADGTFIVPEMGNSGAMTIRDVGYGKPVPLSIRDAAGMLGPIIDTAVARGRRVIVKIDCEGSEFQIFESLEKAGLLDKITAFMVEWHRIYEGKDQMTLLDPLLRRGFMTIDRSPRKGNGFFYAVRAA